MKQLLIMAVGISFSIISMAQSKYADSDREAIKQFANNRETPPRFQENKNTQAVKDILRQYYKAIERLDVTGTENLFSPDAKIFESGGDEGSYSHYMEHHLTPELKGFKSFAYSDYKVEVQVEGSYAFTTENYNYTIVVAKDSSEGKRKGVATSVLKKIKGEWKIIISHNSSRK